MVKGKDETFDLRCSFELAYDADNEVNQEHSGGLGYIQYFMMMVYNRVSLR